MAENKSLTVAQQNVVSFKKLVDGNYVQNQLKQVLKENAGTFATSLMEVYTNDKQLQTCDPKAVMQEAIKAASLKLPLNKQLGMGYILVFKNWDKEKREAVPTPTLVIGYRGYIQLAIRSGQYRNINADVVYEGEYKGFNKLTGDLDLSGEKTSDKIQGFFAYFELVNGFRKVLYMPVEDMARYALKFSPSFRGQKELPKVDDIIDKWNDQSVNGATGQGWMNDGISMGRKTVLRQLLSKYGLLSIEMQNALVSDEPDMTTAEEIREEDNSIEKPVFAQVIEDAQVEEVDDEHNEPPI